MAARRKTANRQKTAAPSKGRRGSGLTKRTNSRRNTKTGRNRMSSANFALPKGSGSKPGQAQYRIDSMAHARSALARVSAHGTASEKRTVRRKVKAKYPSITVTGRR